MKAAGIFFWVLTLFTASALYETDPMGVLLIYSIVGSGMYIGGCLGDRKK